MLNTNDIKRMLDKYPEPEEITKCRDVIVNSAFDMTFVEDGHHYYVATEAGDLKELTSVSKVIEKFTPKVDWDRMAKNTAKKRGVNVEDIQRSWKENSLRSTNNGTSTHLFGEAYMHFFRGDFEWIKNNPVIAPQFENGYLVPYSPKQEAIEAFYMGVYTNTMVNKKVMYPVIPEAKLHTDCYAGTADAIFGYLDKDRKVNLMIYDWKTNASLINEYNRSNSKYMLAPFNEYPYIDENLTHYTIQQSLYQICLENIGYNVVNRSLVWLKDEGTFNRVDVEDVTGKLRNYFKV